MQGCFSLAEQCWHSTKASSAPQLWKQIGWGCIRNWEGTQQGKLTPIDQRDIPCQTISCIEIKAGERREEGHSESWHLPSYIGVVHNEALLSWILLNICLLWWQVILVASSEPIPPHFALLAYTHTALLYLLKYLHLSLQVCALLSFQFTPPMHWWLSGALLFTGINPQQWTCK